MKIKLLTAWLLLLCLALTACHKKPASEPTETDAPLQTAQVVGIRPADSLDWEEGFEFPTQSPETEPPMENEISCLYEFFMNDTNINGKLLDAPAETDESGFPIVGNWTDPARVPNTDRSDLYGTKYHFKLTADKDKHLFCFRYDITTNRLAVVVPNANIPILLVFQVEGMENWEEFVRVAQESEYLSATLIHARNIPNYETMYLLSAFSHLDDQTGATVSKARYIVGKVSADRISLLGSGTHDSAYWMERMLTTYGKDPT